jgi:hypothetical protein
MNQSKEIPHPKIKRGIGVTRSLYHHIRSGTPQSRHSTPDSITFESGTFKASISAGGFDAKAGRLGAGAGLSIQIYEYRYLFHALMPNLWAVL